MPKNYEVWEFLSRKNVLLIRSHLLIVSTRIVSRHNLPLLSKMDQNQTKHEEWHTALHDACACGDFLFELGDELVRRGETLLNGVRALTRPGSAFDRVVLQPRNLTANAANTLDV